MNKKQATNLWTQLRQGFARLEDIIQQIVEGRAWEPLGYDSFAAAWNDRMVGIPLATDAARAAVVYAMFEVDGMSAAEVRQEALSITGLGPERVERIIEQRDRGVSADAITTVRRHLRRLPSPPRIIHVEVTEKEYATFKEVALVLDLDFAAETVAAIRRHFDSLSAGVLV